MNYLVLSTKSALKEINKLAELISKSFDPDVVVFVSKGAYTIGIGIAKYFNIQYIEIFAERSKGMIKKHLSFVLKYIPSWLKLELRKMEMKSSVHKINSQRNVSFGYMPNDLKKASIKRIVLVDDACDTGNTFSQCIVAIKKEFPDATIKTAALNVSTESEKIIKTDYYLYKDYIVSGPWSNDSREHKEFIRKYKQLFNN